MYGDGYSYSCSAQMNVLHDILSQALANIQKYGALASLALVLGSALVSVSSHAFAGW